MTEIVTDIFILRKPCKEVKEGQAIADLVAELFQGLTEHSAQGLAANQIGKSLRVFVMRNDPEPPICLVNPLIAKFRGSQWGEEGCLSLPGVKCQVKRPKDIVIKAQNQYRAPVKYRFSGLKARTACHEVDHLNGKLITDYVK